MGSYVIPNATVDDIFVVIDYAREAGQWHEEMVWDHGLESGILFTDPTRTDEECASLYAGFTPTEGMYRPALAQAIRAHAGHLKNYKNAVRAGNHQTWTAAEFRDNTAHVLADVIDYILLTEDRL